MSTESLLIKAEAEKYGAQIINHPDVLAQDLTNHGDVILHGAREARKILGTDIDCVSILLGNTALNRAEDIDAGVQALCDHKEADSVMTVWQAQDDHPFRAMTIGEDGYLRSFMTVDNVDTNRQSYPVVFFYDQGPWTVRYSSLINSQRGRTGPACWWWMGNRVLPLPRLWVTGRDVHSRLDIEVSRAWLRNEWWRIS